MLEVAHESLLLPGYWRIAWFGRLCQNPLSTSRDLRIRTYLAELDASQNGGISGGAITGPLKSMLLPIGELPRLHLNAVLRDGKLTSDRTRHFTWEIARTRELDCSPSNITVIDRYAVDEANNLIIPIRSKWTHDDVEKSGLFVAFGTSTDRYATIIPAIEIFRFFYATSDVLAKSLLKDHFLDPHTHLWDTQKTAIGNDGRAVLWLRKWMLDADARFLARFAFDNYALQQAQQIVLFAAGQDSRCDERLIRALPPFQDTVKCELLCRHLDETDNGRVLVTRLLSCNWKPNFAELKWDRDNDGRVDPDNREERDPSTWAPSLVPVPKDAAEKIERLLDVAPSLNIPARLREIEITERFPELGKVPADKLPQTGTKTRAEATDWKPIMYQAYQGSVIEGRSSAQCVTRTIIEGLAAIPPIKPQETHAIDATLDDGGVFHVLRLLQRMAKRSDVTVSFLRVLPHFANVQNVPFNVYPEEVDGKRTSWLYVDDTMSRRRMVLLARVQQEKQVYYVIELQRKRPHECSTLVVRAKSSGDIPDGILATLLMDCARARAARLPIASLFSISWGRVRHSTNWWVENDSDFLMRIVSFWPVREKAGTNT